LKRFLFNILHMPVWFFALFSEAKSFQENPIIGNAFLNKMGLHVFRTKLAALMAGFHRLLLSKNISNIKQLEYKKNGLTQEFNFLNQVEFDALKKEVFETVWLLREMRQGGTVTRRVFLNEGSLAGHCPHLHAFINNPELLSTLRYVAGIGGEPIFSIQAIFGEANDVQDPQTVPHADTFHSNAKAWFFLEDVKESDCPFAYVRGSHLLTPKRLAWEKKQSISAKNHPVIYHARGSFRALQHDLLEMGLPAPEKMPVPANTLIVADMFGFHQRSISTQATCRVEIYATLRRNPFLPWLGLDIFSIPYFKRRSGDLSVKWLAQLEKMGLRRMSWRYVGEGTIKEPVRS
jgi:hypothetical protein